MNLNAKSAPEALRTLTSAPAVVRRHIISALRQPQGGHFGGSLSIVEILLAVYHAFSIRYEKDGGCYGGDRLILSKGHGALALYAVLSWLGRLPATLDEYASYGSVLQGHPDVRRLPEVGFSTGSLGLGLAVGLGMGLALQGQPEKIVVILGDGECQEGAIWESALLIARFRLSNVVAIIDANGYQECPTVDGAAPVTCLGEKWKAFGWEVLDCCGHSITDLTETLRIAKTVTDRPTVIVAKTVKGKGSVIIEDDPIRFHCSSVTDEEFEKIMSEV